MDVRVKYSTRVNDTNIVAGDYTAARGNALADAVAQAVLASGAGVDITKYPVESIAKVVETASGPAIIDPSIGLAVPIGAGARISLSTSTSRALPGAVGVSLGASANGYNCYQQVATLKPYDAISVAIINLDTSEEMVCEGVKAAAATRHMTQVNNSSAMEWSNFARWAGLTTVTAPKALLGVGADNNANKIPGISKFSDPIPLSYKERTDTPGDPYLVRIAGHFPPNSVLPSTTGAVVQGINNNKNNPGFKLASMTAAAAIGSLTSNGLSLTEDGGQQAFLAVRFLCEGDGDINLLTVGDSTFAGGTASGSGTSILDWTTSALPRHICTSNYAQSGQVLIDSHYNIPRLLEIFGYHYVYFAAVSPNNLIGGLQTINAMRQQRASTIQAIEVCRSFGAVPVIRTPVAFNGCSPTLMQAHDSWVRGLSGVAKIVDLSEFNAPNWTLKTEYQSSALDGTHWNQSAYLHEAAQLQAVIGISN